MDINDLFPVFGFQILVKDIAWENLLYQISIKKEQFFIFNRGLLLEKLKVDKDDLDMTVCQDKIINNFIQLTNSDALITISPQMPSDKFRTDQYLIYKTKRPYIRAGEYNVKKTLQGLLTASGISFTPYQSNYISGSWKREENIIIGLPYSVEFKMGKTIYEYDHHEFDRLKTILGSRCEGPEKLTVYDICDTNDGGECNFSYQIDIGVQPNKQHFTGSIIS